MGSAIQSPKTACIRSAPSHPFPRLHGGTLIARVFVRLCLISPVLSTVSGAPKFSNLSPNSRSRLHLPAGLCFVALYPFRFVPVRPTQRPPCPSSSSEALPGTPKRPLFVKSSRNLALSRKLSLSRTETLAAAVARLRPLHSGRRCAERHRDHEQC